jgi:hypothetical protein
MRSCSALLLALVAVSAAAAAAYDASFYSKVASCVAQEVRKELVNKISNTVGIAQAPIKANVTFYAVSFTPGIGCTLMSIVTEPGYLNPDTGITSPVQYRPGEHPATTDCLSTASHVHSRHSVQSPSLLTHQLTICHVRTAVVRVAAAVSQQRLSAHRTTYQ